MGRKPQPPKPPTGGASSATALRRGLQRAPGTGDWTYTRPPRRPDDGPIIRPGTNRPSAHIAVVIDTSGSMNRKDHQQATRRDPGHPQTNSPRPAHHRLQLRHPSPHRNQAILNAIPNQTRRRRRHRHVQPPSHTAAQTKPRPAIIIVVTDGYTPWPPTRPPANRATVIAVLTDPDTRHAVPPWITPITTADP